MTTRHIEGGDGVGKYLNDKDTVKSGLAKTLATAARAWREAYGEIPLPSVVVAAVPEVIPQDILGRAILEYKEGPLTPELVDKAWQAIWRTWGESICHAFDVPSCDRTSEDLAELEKEGKAVLLLPDEIYTKEGLILLGRIFPKMQSWSIRERATVTNEHEKGGSIDIEMNIDSPNRNTNEEQAMDILKKEGRRGQRFATFIVGSQFSKLLTGCYLDEGATWSRLPGSRRGVEVLDALFRSDGRLRVVSGLSRGSRGPALGFRSEGVKRA